MCIVRLLILGGLASVSWVACKTVPKKSELRDASAATESSADSSAASTPKFADSAPMSIEKLRQVAFQRCQAATFVHPETQPIPDLDPPQFNSHGVELHYLASGELAPEDASGNYAANTAKGPGIDYSEEGLIQANHDLYASQDFFFRSRPRAALNTLPVQLFVQRDGSTTYERVTWDMAGFDYANSGIDRAIDVTKLPAAGKVLTKLLVGHKTATDQWPQLYDYGSTGYLRFQGYPQVPGASFRTAGAHNVFGKEYLNPNTNQPTPPEDFGLLEAVFFSVQNAQTAQVLALVEGDLFCGAFAINLSPGDESVVDVDSYWYTRRDFSWHDEPNTGFVTYSSMFYHGTNPAADGHHDENTDAAHDSDTLIVNYQDKTSRVTKIQVPTTNTAVYNAPGQGTGSFKVGLFPNWTAGRFQVGQKVEIWSQIAGGEPRTSDGSQANWQIIAVDPQAGTLTLTGDNTRASTITGNDFIFVQGQRLYANDVTDQDGNKSVAGFLLENADRNPVDYTYYHLALKTSSYELRSSYGVQILDSNVNTGVRLIEHVPNKEYLDNLVAFSCLRQDIPRSKTVDEYSHFHYKTWSCYPGSASCPSPEQVRTRTSGGPD